MSRTISEIYDALIVEKESNPALTTLSPAAGETATNLLAELTSGSRVAIWRLLLWIAAVGFWTLENLFDLHIEEIQLLGSQMITGTARWYWSKCFEYQHGDSLSYNATTHRFEYATPNTAIQIVERAAVVDLSGLVKIKVAKLTSGLPDPLDVGELASFTEYINLIKFAGTNVEVISLAADLFHVELTVVFDPLILLPTGESIANAGTFPVEDAVNNYIQNLPFDGILSLTELTDAIQSVSGVVNPVITLAEARPVSGSYSTIDPVTGYNASAGHLIVDAGFPLNTSITYTS